LHGFDTHPAYTVCRVARADIVWLAEEAKKGALTMVRATQVAPCPDCKQKIELWPLLKVGEELLCPYCGAELEVVSTDPVELDWAYLEPATDEDDWDDDDLDE
jgi:lysine biosynthesis protein LysW